MEVVAAVLALIFAAGCSSADDVPVMSPTNPNAASTSPSRPPPGRPFNLVTHCGIKWAQFNGSVWKATEPLSDQGNPPSGWANPVQQGTLVVASADEATFTALVGTVTFTRTDRDAMPGCL